MFFYTAIPHFISGSSTWETFKISWRKLKLPQRQSSSVKTVFSYWNCSLYSWMFYLRQFLNILEEAKISPNTTYNTEWRFNLSGGNVEKGKQFLWFSVSFMLHKEVFLFILSFPMNFKCNIMFGSHQFYFIILIFILFIISHVYLFLFLYFFIKFIKSTITTLLL